MRYSDLFEAQQLPPLYHISFNRNLPSILEPRLPDGYEVDESVYDEFDIPRISFAPSIFQCLQAVYPNVYQFFETPEGQKEGVTYSVFRYDPSSNARVITPEELTNNRWVWDAHITQEYCFIDPVKIYYTGSVTCFVDDDVPGLTIYPYSDHSIAPREHSLFDDARFRYAENLDGEKFKIKFF